MGRIGRSAPKPTQMVPSASSIGSIGPQASSQRRARRVTVVLSRWTAIVAEAPPRAGSWSMPRDRGPMIGRDVPGPDPVAPRRRRCVALLPVWRLHVAGWPTRWLATAWILYTLGILVAVRLPTVRLVIPIVVVAFIAPFIAGPERVTRLLNGRPTAPAVIIDVTPRARPGRAGAAAPRRGRGHRRRPGTQALSGPIGLHGGGEYVTGDERAMDALLAAARAAAGAARARRRHRPDGGGAPAARAGRRPRRAGVPGRRGAGRHRDRRRDRGDPHPRRRERSGARRHARAART